MKPVGSFSALLQQRLRGHSGAILSSCRLLSRIAGSDDPLRADEAISVFIVTVCTGLGTRLGRQFFTLAMFTTIHVPLTITCINVGAS